MTTMYNGFLYQRQAKLSSQLPAKIVILCLKKERKCVSVLKGNPQVLMKS